MKALLPEQQEIQSWINQAKAENKTLILLIAGDSASGKSTRVKQFNFKKILTSTTREPRPGEKNGQDYEFLTEKEFNQAQNEGLFLETTTYGWNSYGTKIKQFLDKLETQETSYLILDIPGIVNVKNILNLKYSKDFLVKTIYYKIDKDTFLTRINSRGENKNKEYIDKRLQENEHAHMILEGNQKLFDLIVDANAKISEFDKSK